LVLRGHTLLEPPHLLASVFSRPLKFGYDIMLV
jgi:hypothetical protein